MRILLATSVLCLAVLILAGVAVVRDIRSSRKRCRRSPAPSASFADHLVSAAERRKQTPFRSVPAQTLRQVMANKSWNRPPESLTVRPNPQLPDPEHQDAHDRLASDTAATRKAPRSSHRPFAERLDWTCFNKNLGDLTDPYQTSPLRTGSSQKAPSPSRI